MFVHKKFFPIWTKFDMCIDEWLLHNGMPYDLIQGQDQWGPKFAKIANFKVYLLRQYACNQKTNSELWFSKTEFNFFWRERFDILPCLTSHDLHSVGVTRSRPTLLLMYFFNLLYTGFRFHDRLPRQFWYLDECVICVKMFSLDTHKHICRFSILVESLIFALFRYSLLTYRTNVTQLNS